MYFCMNGLGQVRRWVIGCVEGVINAIRGDYMNSGAYHTYVCMHKITNITVAVILYFICPQVIALNHMTMNSASYQTFFQGLQPHIHHIAMYIAMY